MEDFVGEYNHQLDAKKRIRIPQEFKSLLGDEFAFVVGPDCIRVYPAQTIRKQIQDTQANINPYNDGEMRAFRNYTRGVKFLKADNQGRVVVPDLFIKTAKLVKDVKSIGVFDHIEILANDGLDDQAYIDFETSRKILEKVYERKNGI